MGSTHPDEWPTPKAPLLAAVARAFLRRRKAIAYHTPIEVGLEIEDPEDGTLPAERLNVDAGGLRLSVWPDGQMWFRACEKDGKRGWRFLVILRGEVGDAKPNEIVGYFEKSMLARYADEGPRDYLLAAWAAVTPVVETSAP